MTGRLNRFVVFGLMMILAPLVAQAAGGPLQVRNQFPLFLPVMPPYLESAEARDAVFAGLSHSSVYVVKSRSSWTVNMDMELTEFDLRIKKKAGQTLELGIDVPVIRPSGGFFDRPLDRWHGFLDVPDYGRSARPYNAFLYEITRNNGLLVKGVNDRSGLGDVRLTAKQVIRSAAPLVSVMAGIEAPTGDAKTGYGSGSYDGDATILTDFRFSERYQGTLNIGVTVPGDFRGYQTVSLRPFWHGGLSFEASWWRSFSIIAQICAQTSPLPVTDIRKIDTPGVVLTMGGRYAGPTGNIELSLTEDLDTAGAPDFTATVGYGIAY